MKSNKSYKISVITPSLNNGDKIEKAIKSVLKQDYRNWEHIIIDGGSTDKTMHILKQYPHIKWISEKDRGQADAMNKGFKLSSGDVIVYLNADDYFYSGAFSAVIKEFNKGARFVVGNIKVKSKRLKSTFINYPKVSHREMLHYWKPNAFPVNSLGYFYLREIQNKFKFNSQNNTNMDLEFLIDVSSKYKFNKINRILGCFEDGLDTKTGVSQSRLDFWQKNNFLFIDKYLNVYSKEEKTIYEDERRNGYCEMQSLMNSLSGYENNIIDKNNHPLISVIIPVYNDQKHIRRAVNSVLNQEAKNIEVIVTDDSSTDKTIKILKEKYEKNKKVRLFFHKKNRKLGWQRNFGITKARGKYIFFLDSDDLISKQALIQLVSIAEKYKTEVVACGINSFTTNTKRRFYHGFDFASYDKIDNLNYFADYKIASVVWNKLYLRKFIITNNIAFNTKYWHEDVAFTRNVIFLCKKYISISKPFYQYYQQPNSITHKKQNLLHLKSYLFLYKDMCNFLDINKIESKLKEKLLESHCFNNVYPNLLRYVDSRSENEFKNDLLRTLNDDFKQYSDAITQFISQLLLNLSSINKNNFELRKEIIKLEKSSEENKLTHTEIKLIKFTRKIKHLIIPEGSLRMKVFRNIKLILKNVNV